MRAGVHGVFVLIFAIRADPAQAQMFSYAVDRPQAVQSLSFIYQIIDFRYAGGGDPPIRFDFEAPAYGVLYTRPNLRAAVSYGRDSRANEPHVTLLQAAITTWGDLWLGARASGLSVPIGIMSNYRRVVPEGSEDSLVDAFNVTVLGLGAGLSYAADLGDRLRLAVRAMPGIGLAVRAFGDSAGSSYLLDGAVDLHSIQIAGRFGISASYGYRVQVWNLAASDLLLEQTGDLLDYGGSEHTVGIGVNW